MTADLVEKSPVEVNRFIAWLREGGPSFVTTLKAERDAIVVQMGEMVAAERVGSTRASSVPLEQARERLWKLNATIETVEAYLAGRIVLSSVRFIATP